jgi:hypothetical protein
MYAYQMLAVWMKEKKLFGDQVEIVECFFIQPTY